MKGHYPGKEIDIVSEFSNNPSLDNYTVDDAFDSFNSLPRYGDFIAVHEGNLNETDAYTGINNHFQGIQRLRDGQHIVLSGGNINDQHAHLFIARLSFYGIDPKHPKKRIPNKIRTGPFGSNVMIKEQIPNTDRLKDIVCLETGNYWHAGGITLMGDVLAVPLENRKDNKSVIAFYNLKKLNRIERLSNMIIRAKGKCGAVAITKLPNGKLLCISWSDDDELPNRFQFYLSKKTNSLKSFVYCGVVNYEDIEEKPNGKSKFQAIQIIQQSDGKLFILANQNTNKFAPKLSGNNEGLLFRLELYQTKKSNNRRGVNPKIKFISKRKFAGGGDYFNFGAACGIYINERKELTLYSGYHWRKNGSIRFAEFNQEPKRQKIEIRKIEDSRIELFEDKNCKKRRINIYGKKFSKLKKYNELYVHGIYFDDKISSIRFALPKGVKYRIYDDSNFNELKKDKNYLTLLGTGYVEVIKDLNVKDIKGLKYDRNFNDKGSSSRFV